MAARFTTAISDLSSKISQKLTNTGDSNYFNTNPRNRSVLQDLKEGLASSNVEKKMSALKKIIALMSNGKDVSSLFPEVISCMQSSHIVQKKLVYVYIVNTSCVRPNVAVLAVNTFRNDCQDPNPLIRALALRTMSAMHIPKIIPYLVESLKQGLSDSDPYVRRTAVIAVAKAYQTCPDTIISEGFYDKLCEKIRDQNCAVVAATVSSLQDIAIRSGGRVPLELRRDMIPPLLQAVNGCSEWGQIAIIEALAFNYRPRTPREAQTIIDRCAPRLQHANSALVIAAIRIIVLLLPITEIDESVMATHYNKLIPPLVSLLASEPEIQFVALKCIITLLDTHPNKFKFDPSVFFYPYDEPVYVKRLKIECLVRLVTSENVNVIVSEMTDSTHDMDASVSRYAVTAIGRIGTHFSAEKEDPAAKEAATFCTDILLEILENHDQGPKQEAVIHLRTIARATRSPSIAACLMGRIGELTDTETGLSDPRTRNAVANTLALYVVEFAEPLEAFLTIYPKEKELSSYLSTSDDFHSLLTLMFALLCGVPKCSTKQVETSLEPYFEEFINCSRIPIDARDRAVLYQSLFKSNRQLLTNMITNSLSELPKTSLSRTITEPALKRAALMGLGSVGGVYSSGQFQLELPEDESDQEQSEEDAPLIRSYPAPNTHVEPVTQQSTEPQIPVIQSSRSTFEEVSMPKFDITWEGLTKEGFIHRWHAYNGKDAFSFGRLSNGSVCSFEQVKSLMISVGLKYVRERHEMTFDALFFCGKMVDAADPFVCEIDIQKTGNGIKLSVRAASHLVEIMNLLKTKITSDIPDVAFN